MTRARSDIVLPALLSPLGSSLAAAATVGSAAGAPSTAGVPAPSSGAASVAGGGSVGGAAAGSGSGGRPPLDVTVKSTPSPAAPVGLSCTGCSPMRARHLGTHLGRRQKLVAGGRRREEPRLALALARRRGIRARERHLVSLPRAFHHGLVTLRRELRCSVMTLLGQELRLRHDGVQFRLVLARRRLGGRARHLGVCLEFLDALLRRAVERLA